MLDRQACERRVYRLAALLTGRRASAVRVIEQVLRAKPNLQSLDSEHMDRLTVLRSREQATATPDLPELDRNIATALADLTSQQREAWVFISVYQLDDRTAAKAMDCSFRAARQHHDLADAQLRTRLGRGVPDAAKRVREAMMQVDVPAFYRDRQRRRRRTKRILLTLAIVAGALIAVAVLLWVASAV